MEQERWLEDSFEKFYWLGFIFADGSIKIPNEKRTWGHELTLRISEKDIEAMEKYSKFTNRKIFYRKQNYIIKGINKTSVSVGVSLYNKEVLNHLTENFDLKPNKTYNPPENLNIENDDKFISFMIGYIDGDGHISHREGNILVGCHYSWENVLNKWFERLYYLSDCTILNNHNKMPKCRIEITGNSFTDTLSKLCKIQISDYRIKIFLKRKVEELNLPVLKRKWDRIIEKDIKVVNTLENRKEIFKLLEEGFTVNEIMKKINVSRATVLTGKNEILKENPNKKYNWKITKVANKEDVLKIREKFINEKLSIKQLSCDFGYSIKCISEIINNQSFKRHLN